MRQSFGPDNFGYTVLLIGMLVAALIPLVFMWIQR